MRCLYVGGSKQQTMYRYCVDNAVTYTSEDLILFRESPFACWMERLTLENPAHGIPPDLDTDPPGNSLQPQDELAETLRTEGKQVALVDWDAAEPERRRETLEAMRQGIDFVVNGHLALGPLSGSANLLMRTSGFSELGNYLYIPCDTQAKTTMHSAFRLCFLADLLHSLQGQLPAQMLIIRGGSDLVPLHTEDHIYHYRAVKQRFMAAMREFRKHRMPDPAESSHFGRWSDCANEVMKQRALHSDSDAAIGEVVAEEEQQVLAVAVAGAQDGELPETEVTYQNPIEARLATSKGLKVSGTLADQARALHPSATPPSDPAPRVTAEARAPSQTARRAIDKALENLSFIGSETAVGAASESPAAAAPASAAGPEWGNIKQHPLDSVAPFSQVPPTETEQVDRDIPEPAANAATFTPEGLGTFEVDCIDDSDYRLPAEPEYSAEPPPVPEPALVRRSFSSSLNTAGEDRD